MKRRFTVIVESVLATSAKLHQNDVNLAIQGLRPNCTVLSASTTIHEDRADSSNSRYLTTLLVEGSN